MSISNLGPGITTTTTIQNTAVDNTTIGAATPSTGAFTTVSATSGVVTTVSAATEYVDTLIQPVAIISALGTTQAAAAPLTAVINRGQGVTDGQTTGFRLLANKAGWVQYLINETAVSGNLWPPTGGKINNAAANAVFVLAANTSYTIFHYAASAYGVK